ncbi:MAG: hypothetical protein AAGK09_09420 [Planctomycetota bacterium]
MDRSTDAGLGRTLAARLLTALAVIATATAASAQQPESERKYYVIEDIPTPEGVVFEAGAMTMMSDDRMAVATRRGDIYLVDHLFGPVDDVTFTEFATGLDEPLGLVWKDDWLYASEHTQLVRLKDEDGDGVADIYETFNDEWGSTPDYHEYNFLAPPDKDGNMWAVLCLTYSSSSPAYMRGWAVRITPEGEMLPSVAGIRSPGGVGYDANGELFYNDNQGLWNGTNHLKHLKLGSHAGNHSGNKWYDKAKADLVAKGYEDYLGDDPGFPEAEQTRNEDERKRNPRFVPPTIAYPFNLMGRSPTGIVWDNSEGKFGPFAGQMFVGEITHSQVNRIFLEEVNGVMQGAVFHFVSGFKSGPVGVVMTEEGYMFVGQTNRGWGSRGNQPYGFERVRWTGEVPFEVHEMRIEPDGFTLTFTEPVDPATAGDPASYAMKSWTYWYQAGYGSPEIDHTDQTITAAEVADDGMSVRLTVEGVVQGHLHELKMEGVRSAEDPEAGLWHPVGYYTVNEIPE